MALTVACGPTAPTAPAVQPHSGTDPDPLAAQTQADARRLAAASPADKQRALELYRGGVNLRLSGDPAGALKVLRRAHELAPHPLTLVQIGLANESTDQIDEMSAAYARAMALAELLGGAPARPALQGRAIVKVRQLAVRGDGLWLATAGDDTVSVWDTSGRLLRTLPVSAEALSFTADGMLDTGAARWDPATGRRLPDAAATPVADAEATAKRIGVDADMVDPQLALSADGRWLAAADQETNRNPAITVWDVTSGRKVRTVHHDWFVKVLALTADGSLLIAGTSQGKFRSWDVATGTQMASWTSTRFDSARGLGVAAPDGSWIALSFGDGVELWDPRSGDPLRRIPGAETTWVYAGYSGQRVVLWGSTLDDVFWWDGTSPQPRRQRATAGVMATDLQGRLAWASPREVELADFHTGTLTRFAGERMLALEFSHDGGLLAMSGLGGARVVRLDGTEAASFKTPGFIVDLAFTPDDRLLVGSSVNEAFVWNLATGATERKVPASNPRIEPGSRLAIGPSGEIVMGGGVDLGGDVVVFTADGRTLLSGDERGGVEAVEPGGRRLWRRSISGHPIRWLASSAGGDAYVVSDLGGVTIGDLATGVPRATLIVESDGSALLVGADGKVDGTAGGLAATRLSWRTGDFQLPGFVGWQRHHDPGLLRRTLGWPAQPGGLNRAVSR